jgi:hypothetical protein
LWGLIAIGKPGLAFTTGWPSESNAMKLLHIKLAPFAGDGQWLERQSAAA